MLPDENVSSIADASRPNAGRIYDYLLGGNHNFEIDRQAAQQLLNMVPEMPQWVRLIRWFLGESVRRLLKEGFTHFLDFASGLPTVDHIHQIAPAGTRVIYSDIDPVTVAYARDIIKGNTNVVYLECDASKPEALLESDVVSDVFGKQRRVAIGFNGIAWFVPDSSIAHSLSVLYDWADKGSKLFISDLDTQGSTGATAGGLEFYKKVGQPVYPRPTQKLQELIGRWRVQKPGFQPLTEWVGLSENVTDEARKTVGGGNIRGAILQK